MKLIWYRYNNKYNLGIHLGTHGDKTVILDNALLSKPIIFIIRQSLSEMASLADAIHFIRSKLPEATRAIKTLHTDKLQITKEYEIKPAS